MKGKESQRLTKEFCSKNHGPYPVYSGQTENNGVMASINKYEFDSNYLNNTIVEQSLTDGMKLSFPHKI